MASGRENAKALATEPGHGTTGVVLTTVLILCHDEPGHMVGRRGAKHFGEEKSFSFLG